jgi:dTDP-glucose 4,6-dehydratase
MKHQPKILVTGGSGFIGSALIRHLIHEVGCQVVNVDKLTYAANEKTLASVIHHTDYHFERADICDSVEINRIFQQHQPDAVIHAAAESHVDRSIDASSIFMQTNIMGTHVMLEASRDYFSKHPSPHFRFLHLSTDEVYGDLTSEGCFTESSPYRPNSPYSSSKASSDLLVRAWHQTYGLPTLQTNSSNNYGPWQHEEKLIPRMVRLALAEKLLPIFGTGQQVRDWIHVDDHARAIAHVLTHGIIGETYNVGANCEKTNLEIVETICSVLDETHPLPTASQKSYRDFITHVDDRLGHDFRYALDTKKINDLGWKPQIPFSDGLLDTIEHIRSPRRAGEC